MERNTKKVSDSMVEQVFQVRPEHLNGAGRLFGGQLMGLMKLQVLLGFVIQMEM